MSTDDTVIISANKLSIDAGPIRLFDNLSFKLKAGHGLILRGPNGIGKTSLLRAIAGFDTPAHGQVSFGTYSDPSAFNLRDNCHYLGHKNGLKPRHTIYENLTFFQKFDEREKLSITDIAQQLQFSSLLDLPVSVLSAGQARRVAFARLLVSNRPIWLLDEPTASLDKQTSHHFERLSLEHLKQGGMIIAATHLPFLSQQDQCQTLNIKNYQAEDFHSSSAQQEPSP